MPMALPAAPSRALGSERSRHIEDGLRPPERGSECEHGEMTDRFDAVVFDWYATLGAPAEHDWWQQMFEMIELAGGSTPDDARSNWANPATELPEHSSDKESYRAYEARLLHDLLAASQLPDGTKGELLESILRMRDQESIAIYPDVRALLMDLKAAGTTVA